jgi:hypothetical protein
MLEASKAQLQQARKMKMTSGHATHQNRSAQIRGRDERLVGRTRERDAPLAMQSVERARQT